MFNTKKTNLFDTAQGAIGNKMTSAFTQAASKISAETRSGNDALKYSTTGDAFVDQFGTIGQYLAPREYAEVDKCMRLLWSINPIDALKFTVYIRLITRSCQLSTGEKTETVQRGAGLKHEGILRMMWIAVNHPNTFATNLELFISAGSWKDVFYMMQYDLVYNGWDDRKLPWEFIGHVIMAGLENPTTSELVKKYLPQIKARSNCKTVWAQADTIIGKWLCSIFGISGDYKAYRLLKSSGTAHTWQQLISQHKMLKIDFNTVHGKALSQMVSSKFLKNNNLEQKYLEWIMAKPVAKYTGFVHELFQKFDEHNILKTYTINAQFNTLVETAKKNAKKGTSLIVVRDTSGSMGALATGSKMSCFDIGKALALFFSEMLPAGKFANSWIEFNRDAKLHNWKGKTACEKWINDYANCVGNTNFQSVINLFTRVKNTGVAENEFPTGIICISDGEFDKTSLDNTNVNAAKNTLKSAGFSQEYIDNFKIVLWNLQSNYYGETTGKKFETYGNEKNTFYFSGFDGSVLAFLTGVEYTNKETKEPTTAEELFKAAMDQELLNLLEV